MTSCTIRLILILFVAPSSPVAQLGRVPGALFVSRAAKKRADMITAFDELSSHLHTTFSALSTALAHNSNHAYTDTAYLALVLGPTIGAPKARVVLALEGLEVKVSGMREDVEKARLSSEGPQGEGYSDEDGSDNESETRSDSQGVTEENTSSDADEELPCLPPPSEPPSSRSPSPFSEEPLQPSSVPQPYLVPKPACTYAEEQQTLRAAERLLARTLVNAQADGGGMAAEIGPTQTHVLLRAPRRFLHPAWLPRQNVSASLDSMLQDFLVDTGLHDDAPIVGNGKTRRRVGGVKTEGVLVTCQTKTNPDEIKVPHSPSPAETVRSEEDELIWWVWSGKLTGFAEW
ncbi:hypothetical protein B0F90DRAFT_1716173 [Multifurca ochricompacta]|uniref:Uncharacterized protein n=1 Tax=Multifurca ochricompacta TaxID=376703 RepID=A0AAD4M5G7_9AGAM|nr:hypothetical protein B0F90DRAFT_1716173 [Multifurca ochricompacta]